MIHSQLTPLHWSPSLIYEPIPSACLPSELDPLRTLLPHLTVFSPNHEEAAGFFDISPAEINAQGRDGVQKLARRFLEEGAGGAVVIRSGPLGAFAISQGEEEGVWVDAWYQYGDDKVKDVTGAGNSFLVSSFCLGVSLRLAADELMRHTQGGLMAGLALRPDELLTAMQMASISVRPSLVLGAPLRCSLLITRCTLDRKGLLHYRAIRSAHPDHRSGRSRAVERRVAIRSSGRSSSPFSASLIIIIVIHRRVA